MAKLSLDEIYFCVSNWWAFFSGWSRTKKIETYANPSQRDSKKEHNLRYVTKKHEISTKKRTCKMN